MLQFTILSQIQIFNQQSIMSFVQTAFSVILFLINQFFNSEFIFQQSKSEFFFFSAIEFRIKKKFFKKFKKKIKIQFIIKTMNDITKIYDRFFSIRNVLKRNKMNISVMN